MISPEENNIIKLDVGGVRYKTSLNTLTQYQDSMLANMFSGRHSNKSMIDSDGYYFIDRDGTIFGYIIIFLRNGTLDLDDTSKSVVKSILTEADYFNISKLVELCNKKLNDTISIKDIDLLCQNFNVNVDELSREFNHIFSIKMLKKYNVTQDIDKRLKNIDNIKNYKNVNWNVHRGRYETYYWQTFINLYFDVLLYNDSTKHYLSNGPVKLFHPNPNSDIDMNKVHSFILKWSRIKHNNLHANIDNIKNSENELKHIINILNSKLINHPYNNVDISYTTTPECHVSPTKIVARFSFNICVG